MADETHGNVPLGSEGSQGNLNDSKGNSIHNRASGHQLNPFENSNVHSYSHRANFVPPYVLDKLEQAHYKEQLSNSNVNNNQADINPTVKTIHSKIDDNEYLSFTNDPFVKTVRNNWHDFLSSVKHPSVFSKDMDQYDQSLNKEYDLKGAWGGEERLRLALLGNNSLSDEQTRGAAEGAGLFCGMGALFKNRGTVEHELEKTRVRSNARYWMSDEKRADLLPTMKRLFIHNPLVPLLLRILILIFSVCALALACTIFIKSNSKYGGYDIEQQPSTIMAVVVQCVAIVYVIYIAYDEYSGKPLGIRNPLGKMKLIMLDLLFIIFMSADLSLTFNTLYDNEWVCQNDNTPELTKIGIYYPSVSSICRRQRALAAFLFVILCLWVLTFTISIMRVVDRVSLKSPRRD